MFGQRFDQDATGGRKVFRHPVGVRRGEDHDRMRVLAEAARDGRSGSAIAQVYVDEGKIAVGGFSKLQGSAI